MAKKILKKARLFFRYSFLISYWFIFRPNYKGAKVVIRSGGELLLIRHTFHPHYWTFAGGTVEKDEEPIYTAVRELKEELDLTVSSSDLKFLGAFENIQFGKNDLCHCFQLEVGSKEVKIDGVELCEARWFPVEKLPKNLGRKNARRILALYQQSL